MSIDSVEFTLDEIGEPVKDTLRADLPVMLRGRHGIGKSDYLKQVADELDLPYIDKRISQMSPGDLLGLPDDVSVVDYIRNLMRMLAEQGQELSLSEDSSVLEHATRLADALPDEILRERNVTQFSPPEWYQRACEEPVLLLLDEINRGEKEVRQGIFELGDSGSLFGNELHEDTKLVTATNGGMHSADYTVHQMDHAALSRWIVFDVKADHKVWAEWAHDEDEMLSFIIDFVMEKPMHFMHGYNEAGADWQTGRVYPEPRSWHRLSKILKEKMEVEDLTSVKEIDPKHLYKLAVGTVGPETAQDLRNHLQDYDREMTVEELLAGDFDDLEDWGEPDFTRMIQKFDATGIIKERILTDDEREALLKFLKLCPSDNYMQFIQVITTLKEQDIEFAQEQVAKFLAQEMPVEDEDHIDVEEDTLNLANYTRKVVMGGEVDLDVLQGTDEDEEEE